MRAARWKNPSLLLLLSALWGTAFMFNALGLRSFTPFLFAAFRFDLAGVMLLTLSAARGRATFWPATRADWTGVLVAAALMAAAHNAIFLWGLQFTTAGISAVIVGLNPLIMTGATRIFLQHERVGLAGYAGLLLGLVGVVVLTLLKPGQFGDVRGIGEAMILVSVAVWALGSVLVERVGPRMGLVAFTGWQCLVAGILLHGAAFAAEDGGRATFDLGGVAALLYLAVMTSGAGLLLYFYLVPRIGQIRVNLWSYIAPAFATVASFLVLDEPFEPRAAFALALIAGGFLLVIRRPTPTPAAAHVPTAVVGPRP